MVLSRAHLVGSASPVVGIDAAVFWGAVMAVLSVIPGIGATLVWAPAVIYLLVSGQTVAGLGLLVWSAGVVGTIDNVLRPVLVGRGTEMPDLLILLATLGGLGLCWTLLAIARQFASTRVAVTGAGHVQRDHRAASGKVGLNACSRSGNGGPARRLAGVIWPETSCPVDQHLGITVFVRGHGGLDEQPGR